MRVLPLSTRARMPHAIVMLGTAATTRTESTLSASSFHHLGLGIPSQSILSSTSKAPATAAAQPQSSVPSSESSMAKRNISNASTSRARSWERSWFGRCSRVMPRLRYASYSSGRTFMTLRQALAAAWYSFLAMSAMAPATSSSYSSPVSCARRADSSAFKWLGAEMRPRRRSATKAVLCACKRAAYWFAGGIAAMRDRSASLRRRSLACRRTISTAILKPRCQRLQRLNPS